MPNGPTNSPTTIHSSSIGRGAEEVGVFVLSAWFLLLWLFWLFWSRLAVIDLQPYVTFALQCPRCTHECAHRLGDTPLAPDHLAEIGPADLQPDHRRIAIIADGTNLHPVGIVNEIAGDEF